MSDLKSILKLDEEFGTRKNYIDNFRKFENKNKMISYYLRLSIVSRKLHLNYYLHVWHDGVTVLITAFKTL